MGICPSGKDQHLDRQAANEQLVSLKRDSKVANMHAYHCLKCDRWHIGHIPGSKTTKHRKPKGK